MRTVELITVRRIRKLTLLTQCLMQYRLVLELMFLLLSVFSDDLPANGVRRLKIFTRDYI